MPVGLSSWLSCIWTTWSAWWQKLKIDMTSVKVQQVQMFGCSAAGEQTFLHTLGAHVPQMWLKLTVQVYLLYSVVSFQSAVKLEWFLYTVRMMVPTKSFLSWPIWIHTGVLRTCSSTQQCLHRPVMHTMHQCWCHGNSARKLRISVHLPTHWWWIWLINGIVEAMQRKVKIDERLGLARPRV